MAAADADNHIARFISLPRANFQTIDAQWSNGHRTAFAPQRNGGLHNEPF
jgi:hypothetical protein